MASLHDEISTRIACAVKSRAVSAGLLVPLHLERDLVGTAPGQQLAVAPEQFKEAAAARAAANAVLGADGSSMGSEYVKGLPTARLEAWSLMARGLSLESGVTCCTSGPGQRGEAQPTPGFGGLCRDLIQVGGASGQGLVRVRLLAFLPPPRSCTSPP